MIDSIEDEKDDDPYDFTPPPGPSPREVRRRWVEEGNVGAFLDLIHGKAWSLFSIHEQLRNLQRACEVKAMRDPAGFSGEMFGRIVAFNAFLVLRSQLLVEERIVGRGELPSTPTLADLSNDVAERLLPRLMEMQRGLAEILVAQAKAARVWTLTQGREARAELAVAAVSRSPRRRQSSGKKSGRTGPDAANAKPDGPREGVVPLPSRSRRRG